jgi:hypothetical protein
VALCAWAVLSSLQLQACTGMAGWLTCKRIIVCLHLNTCAGPTMVQTFQQAPGWGYTARCIDHMSGTACVRHASMQRSATHARCELLKAQLPLGRLKSTVQHGEIIPHVDAGGSQHKKEQTDLKTQLHMMTRYACATYNWQVGKPSARALVFLSIAPPDSTSWQPPLMLPSAHTPVHTVSCCGA